MGGRPARCVTPRWHYLVVPSRHRGGPQDALLGGELPAPALSLLAGVRGTAVRRCVAAKAVRDGARGAAAAAGPVAAHRPCRVASRRSARGLPGVASLAAR